jgi:hypothetical protein
LSSSSSSCENGVDVYEERFPRMNTCSTHYLDNFLFGSIEVGSACRLMLGDCCVCMYICDVDKSSHAGSDRFLKTERRSDELHFVSVKSLMP